MRIALFGGAFDPPHLGHSQVAAELLRHKLVDEVWYVPVKHHPFGKTVSSDAHRRAMVELIVTPQTRLESFELDQAKPSYSIDTLESLSRQHPFHRFSWVMGSDNLSQFYRWHRFEDLLTFPFFVYPRAGYPLESLSPEMRLLRDVPEVVVSSTQVRDWVRQGKSISQLVDPRVEQYIVDHHLYR